MLHYGLQQSQASLNLNYVHTNSSTTENEEFELCDFANPLIARQTLAYFYLNWVKFRLEKYHNFTI